MNGKSRLLKVANYRAGKLHGEYREYDNNRLKLHQFFSNGTLVLPRSQREIDATLARIARLSIKMQGRDGRYGYPKLLDKKWLRQKYVVERLSLEQIGRLAGHTGAVPLATARRYMIKPGIPRRKPGADMRRL